MTFGFHLSLDFFMGADQRHKQQRNDENTNGARSSASNRQRETSEQRSIRTTTKRRPLDRRQRELEARQDPSDKLEIAAASNSERAKALDRISLAALEQATKNLALRRQWSTETPPSAWKYPIIHELKGVGSDPRRYLPSPSSRSPPSSRSRSAEGRIEVNDPSVRAAKRGLKAELDAAERDAHSIEDMATGADIRRRSQLDSVYRWFEELEGRDGGDEFDWEGVEENISRSVGSTPMPSPEVEEEDCDGDGGTRPSQDMLQNAAEVAGQNRTEPFDSEDWMHVEYLSDVS